MIIPKHLFADYIGAKSRDAPTNLKPVGTGPYKFVDFKPGDMVKGELNPNYHIANRPHFDTIEMKGGGDAVSAARAVLQTGEYDYAWNMQVEDEILQRLEKGGKGVAVITPGGNIEHIQLNSDRSLDRGRRRALEPQDQASAALRSGGAPGARPAGRPQVGRGAHLRPHRHRDRATSSTTRSASARRTRSGSSTSTRRTRSSRSAGWKKGADGIRAKDGKKLKFVYQTSINTPRQKTQAIVKQACQKAGIDIELKSVTASVFFSSDVANPDTYTKFYCDMQMYTTTMTQPDPEVFMNQFTSWEVATKENKWQGRNITRWRSEEYDKTFRAAEGELDPVKRAALFIRMNDLVVRRPRGHPGGLPAARCRHLAASSRRRSAAGTTTSGTSGTGTGRHEPRARA